MASTRGRLLVLGVDPFAEVRCTGFVVLGVDPFADVRYTGFADGDYLWDLSLRQRTGDGQD